MPDIRSLRNIRTVPDIRRDPLYPATVLSQYVHSPCLMSLVRGAERSVDPAPGIEEFLRRVADPLTADSWGLDQWGKIVDIGRIMTLQGEEATFGFSGSGLAPFEQGVFFDRDHVSTSTYRLADNAYRDLVLLKAAANISDCSVPSLNRLLARLYGERGRAYVLEVGTMRIRYVFEFTLRPWERALMGREDVPPKPAGVGFEIFEVDPQTFGFAGSSLHPFNQGAFLPRGPVDAYTC